MKFARVCIVGLPNVGKSTLFNSIVKKYLAPVTHKPQTTINKLEYIIEEGETQIILSDLPGIVNKNIDLKKYINKTVRAEIFLSDIIVLVLNMKFTSDAEISLVNMVNTLCENQIIVIVLNKSDLCMNVEKITHYQKKYQHVLVTNKKTQTLLRKYLAHIANYGEWKFKSNQQILNFNDWSCEITRQIILENFHQEVPYNIDVKIVKIENNNSNISIYQNIIATKKSYKYILLKQSGKIIKYISKKASIIISQYLNQPVQMFLHVKICDTLN